MNNLFSTPSLTLGEWHTFGCACLKHKWLYCCSELHYTAMYYTVLHCTTAMYCTVLHCSSWPSLQSMALHLSSLHSPWSALNWRNNHHKEEEIHQGAFRLCNLLTTETNKLQFHGARLWCQHQSVSSRSTTHFNQVKLRTTQFISSQ